MQEKFNDTSGSSEHGQIFLKDPEKRDSPKGDRMDRREFGSARFSERDYPENESNKNHNITRSDYIIENNDNYNTNESEYKKRKFS